MDDLANITPNPTDEVKDVDIKIGTNLYARLQDMKNTPSHVFAEFVDNALQSYLDHEKELKELHPNYKFTVSIESKKGVRPEFDEIEIRDNAAGIDKEHFLHAFTLGFTPPNTDGLNEFGMGLKTASLWLGSKWTVRTSALGENKKRTVSFNLDEVIAEQKMTLPVEETDAPERDHYTIITISKFTKNFDANRTTSILSDDLASLFRRQLREKVMSIQINDRHLHFETPAILKAPALGDSGGKRVTWKKDIDFTFGSYRAKGFIALLDEMSTKKNGIVLLRRGRVIYGGEEEMQYHPKVICGPVGSPRYKRIFGELELEGFEVTFSKNGVKETEDLNALMEALKDELNKKEFNLLNQADNYRLNETAKKVKKYVENVRKTKSAPVSVSTTELETKYGKPLAKEHAQPQTADTPASTPATTAVATHDNAPTPAVSPADAPKEVDNFADRFVVDGVQYEMQVKYVYGGNMEVFSINVDNKKENRISCLINVQHPLFLEASGVKLATPLLKAMAMAAFTTQEKCGDDDETIGKMLIYFNDYLRQIKV